MLLLKIVQVTDFSNNLWYLYKKETNNLWW